MRRSCRASSALEHVLTAQNAVNHVTARELPKSCPGWKKLVALQRCYSPSYSHIDSIRRMSINASGSLSQQSTRMPFGKFSGRAIAPTAARPRGRPCATPLSSATFPWLFAQQSLCCESSGRPASRVWRETYNDS